MEQAAQKHPFATSDNVSYVRLFADFRQGIHGLLFFAGFRIRLPCWRSIGLRGTPPLRVLKYALNDF